MQQVVMSLAAVVETRSTVVMEPFAACRPFAIRHSLNANTVQSNRKMKPFIRNEKKMPENHRIRLPS